MNRSGSNGRRSTFSAGEGAENVINQLPSSSSKNQPPSSSSKVRWNVPPQTSSSTNNNNGHTTAANTTNSSKLNTSISSSSMTPSKRIKDRFVNVASGKKNDAVFSYHFDGTPFSQRKPKRGGAKKLHHHQHQHQHQRHEERINEEEGGQEDATTTNLLDNTFHLGNDTTAEILNMNNHHHNDHSHTDTTNTNDDEDLLNNSLLSLNSKSSISTTNTSSSEMMDVMNCTTLSDTHELSTSNFIQNAKMRNVLAERAKSLFGEAERRKKEKEEEERRRLEKKEKEKKTREMAGNPSEKVGETNGTTASGEKQQQQIMNQSDDASCGVEATMTLPDLTLNLSGILSDVKKPPPKSSQGMMQQEEEEQSNKKNGPSPKKGGVNEEDADDEMLEFTSHQRSRTPRKSHNDLSLLNSTLEDTTRSVGGLDSMLAEFDDNDDNEDDGNNKVGGIDKNNLSQASNLDELIAESTKMMDESYDEEDKEGQDGVRSSSSNSSRKSSLRETSFVESTASQNDLNTLLGGVDDDDDDDEEEMGGPLGLEEESGMEERNDNAMAVEGEKRRAETSFVESTASQNDLNNLLDVQDEAMEENGEKQAFFKPAEESPAAMPGALEVAESAPQATTQSNTPAGSSSNNSMLPSPSFNSGKKQRGSGIVMMRKSLGGDVSKIRQLTASVRKEKKDRKSRMSLPAFNMGMPHQQAESETVEQRNEPPASPPKKASLTSPAKNMDVDSPARNTRTSRKSPSRKSPANASDSPARNTRSSKNSPAAAVDSPARNTRGAKKKSPLPPTGVDSPARNTRGASKNKSPSRKSPAKTAEVDSPARNTRSAKRGGGVDSPKHSSETSPAARSLFNSPSDTEVFQETGLKLSAEKSGRGGPFSGRKRAFDSSSGPPKKRFSTSPEHSSSSLSKEYPFLSLSPKNDENAAHSNASNDKSPTARIEDGTQTLMFGDLMQGIQNEVGKASAKDISLGDAEEEDSGEIEFNSMHSKRNKRRDTADTAELMGILSDDGHDDDSPKAAGTASDENMSPHTPGGNALATKTAKTPKSILGSSKKRGNGPKRNVEFGSPEAAEYNVGSPSVSMTPMNPDHVRERFHMPSEERRAAASHQSFGQEERTAELEGDLERLICKGNDTSILLDPIDEMDSRDVSGTSSEDASFPRAEQTEELETNILHLVDNKAEESEFSLPSISSVSADSTHRGGDLSNNSVSFQQEASEDMSLVENTQTIQLEGTVASLLDGRDNINTNNLPDEDSQTMQLEGTIASLLDGGDKNATSGLPDEKTETMQVEGTLTAILNGRDDVNTSTQHSEESHTMELEGTLGSLLEDRQNARAPRPEETQTMQLEGTLASLLENRSRNGTDHDITLPSLSSNSTPPVRNGNNDSQTMNIEGTMASLLDAAGDNGTGELSAQSHTVPLDNNLEVLLDGAGRDHIPRHDDTISELGMNTASHDLRSGVRSKHRPLEDDTVSELGMNTASHELRTVKEVPRKLAQPIVDTPPEPVDLSLEEIFGQGGTNDFYHIAESRGDVFLDALNVASANGHPSIKPKSEEILTQICDDIEALLDDSKNEALFRDIVDSHEDILRSLQQKIRSNDNSGETVPDMKNQLKLLLQATNESQLGEWYNWLTEVAEVYHGELSGSIIPQLEKLKSEISDRTTLINTNREQVALPLLIRSARRTTKRNFNRTKDEVISCEDEVAELEAQLAEAELQLGKAQAKHERVKEVSKANEKSVALRKGQKVQRQTADSSYLKFFSVERLHNWVLTGSSDSSIGLVFRGLSAETSIQLSFFISSTSSVTLTAKSGSLPMTTNSFLSVTGVKQTRFHPAVSGFLKTKMQLLCKDMRNSHISSPSEIPSVIHFAELRVARLEEAAKEINSILGRCKNSFLQPSETLKDTHDFTAYLTSASAAKGDRLHVCLSIPDCYPFAPIGVQLHSSSGAYDTDTLTRQSKKAAKPGFGALTRAMDHLENMLK